MIKIRFRRLFQLSMYYLCICIRYIINSRRVCFRLFSFGVIALHEIARSTVRCLCCFCKSLCFPGLSVANLLRRAAWQLTSCSVYNMYSLFAGWMDECIVGAPFCTIHRSLSQAGGKEEEEEEHFLRRVSAFCPYSSSCTGHRIFIFIAFYV